MAQTRRESHFWHKPWGKGERVHPHPRVRVILSHCRHQNSCRRKKANWRSPYPHNSLSAMRTGCLTLGPKLHRMAPDTTWAGTSATPRGHGGLIVPSPSFSSSVRQENRRTPSRDNAR